MAQKFCDVKPVCSKNLPETTVNPVRPQDCQKELLLRARQLSFGYIHYDSNPKENEIRNWKPSREMRSNSQWHPCSDNKCGQIDVQSEEDFQHMMNWLKGSTEIGLDIDYQSSHTLKVGEFVVNAIELRKQVKEDLKALLEDGNILKVGFGLEQISYLLQQDFDIFLVGCIDIQLMWKALTGTEVGSILDIHAAVHEGLKLEIESCNYGLSFVSDAMIQLRKEREALIRKTLSMLVLYEELKSMVLTHSKLGEEGFIEICDESKTRILSLSPNISGPEKNPPDYLAIAKEELRSNIPGSWFSPVMLTTLASLLEWRTMISKIFDLEEDILVTGRTLARMARQKPQNVDEIRAFIRSAPKDVINYDPTGKPRQEVVILRIIETNGHHMKELRNMECHNCLKKGHGAAWACPLPRNRESLKIFMNRPENRHYKLKQCERRRKNWEFNKYGEGKGSSR